MLKYIKTVIFGSSLLLVGGLQAQVNQDRDQYYDQMPARTATGNAIDQVRADLDQCINNGSMRGWQQRTLMQARHDLAQAERSGDRDMTRHEVDRAMDRIQNVSNSDRINGDQRAMLQHDVNRLREFRDSGITYSSRENPDYRSNGYYDHFGNWHPNR